MSALVLSILISLLLMAGAFCGTRLRRLLPPEHLDDSARDVVRLGAGLVATLAALVLSLLISSAKSAYDVQSNEVRQLTSGMITLDTMLEQYGAEATPVRRDLRRALAAVVDTLWATTPPRSGQPYAPSAAGLGMYRALLQLAPVTDEQRFYKGQATATAIAMLQQRLTLYEQGRGHMPAILVAIITAWLFMLFMSFSLFSPLRPTAMVAIALIALSAGGAFFLIFEMYEPFSGLLQIDREPLLRALPALAP